MEVRDKSASDPAFLCTTRVLGMDVRETRRHQIQRSCVQRECEVWMYERQDGIRSSVPVYNQSVGYE